MSLTPEIEDIHRQACLQGKDSYADPATGYTVFTAHYHKRRGKCCGNMCRHCPYEHVNVPAKKAAGGRSSRSSSTSSSPSSDSDDSEHDSDEGEEDKAALKGQTPSAPLSALSLDPQPSNSRGTVPPQQTEAEQGQASLGPDQS